MAVEQNKDNKRIEKRKTSTNKYPNEKVWISQGGYKVTYGNEKGKEFVRMEHPSGQMTEIYPDGKMITMNIGDVKQYNKAGLSITIDENQDIHINGHNNIKVGGGSHIEVVGNAGIAVGGDIALVGMKNFNFDVQNCYMGIRGDFGMKVEGGATWDITGDAIMKSGQKITNEAPNVLLKGDIDLGDEGGQLLHRKGDVDSDGDTAVGSASKVRAV